MRQCNTLRVAATGTLCFSRAYHATEVERQHDSGDERTHAPTMMARFRLDFFSGSLRVGFGFVLIPLVFWFRIVLVYCTLFSVSFRARFGFGLFSISFRFGFELFIVEKVATCY